MKQNTLSINFLNFWSRYSSKIHMHQIYTCMIMDNWRIIILSTTTISRYYNGSLRFQLWIQTSVVLGEIRIVSIIYEVNIGWLGATWVQTSAAIINLHTICVQSIPGICGPNKYLKPHRADITLILLLHKWQRCLFGYLEQNYSFFLGEWWTNQWTKSFTNSLFS